MTTKHIIHVILIVGIVMMQTAQYVLCYTASMTGGFIPFIFPVIIAGLAYIAGTSTAMDHIRHQIRQNIAHLERTKSDLDIIDLSNNDKNN